MFKNFSALLAAPAGKAVALAASGALLVVGAGGFLATSAYFSDTETITGNQITTATLNLDGTTITPVSVGNLAPNEGRAQTLTFANTSTVPLHYRVAVTNVTSSSWELANMTHVNLWSYSSDPGMVNGISTGGPLAAVPESGEAVLFPGEQLTLDVSLFMDPATGNEAQAATAAFDVVVTANQYPTSQPM